MPETKEKLLITGSEGTIGKVLVRSLANDFNIIRLDRNAPDNDGTVIVTDIAGLESLKKVFEEIQSLKYVIHLAGNPDPSANWESILHDNIIGTRNIYECAKEFGVKRVVFASSTHLFGNYEGYPETSPLGRPIQIEDPFRSDSYYGASKGLGELLARQFYDLHGIESICIRIGAVLPDDKPFAPWNKAWLSHRDLSQVFLKAVTTNIPFGIYFATSENDGMPFDLDPTRKDLGYSPQDKA